MPIDRRNWFCAQIGAREHYAVARALHQRGRLTALYTDFWAGPVTRVMGKSKFAEGKGKLGALRSLAARWHEGIGDRRPETGDWRPENRRDEPEVVAWNVRALLWERRLRRRTKDGDPYLGFIEVGSRFAVRVREALKRRTDLGPDSIFFAYDTGALEAMEWCREQGIKCILNQMDPSRVEAQLVQEEERQWPGWASEAVRVPEAYFVRREQEWALADRVVVNSEFSRQALLRQGVPSEKLAVVPLCYEAKAEVGGRRSEQPLRVLFLGQVILRKGIQYLIEAAKLLIGENIHFDVVGPVGISREAIATAPGNLTFHGRTDRNQAAEWYRRSHLFVLPTLSDGFAITQLEAMAHGLPVITTPCCGEVVSDGADGFVVPARDAGALARGFQRYLAQPDLRKAHSAAALRKADQFTLERLGENLMKMGEESRKQKPEA